jgi:hypothetical protein
MAAIYGGEAAIIADDNLDRGEGVSGQHGSARSVASPTAVVWASKWSAGAIRRKISGHRPPYLGRLGGCMGVVI